jgi:hypothetical protein
MNSPFPPGPPPHWRGRLSRHTRGFLPAAETPEGAIQEGGSSGRNPQGPYAETTLVSPMDLSTLGAHYKTQLEQAGCVFTEEGQQGPLLWNTWTLQEEDEQWYGFFMILKVLDQEYYLTMRMKSENGGKATTER